MSKLLGKTKFEELLSVLIIKTSRKTNFCKKTDKRIEVNLVKNDFMEE